MQMLDYRNLCTHTKYELAHAQKRQDLGTSIHRKIFIKGDKPKYSRSRQCQLVSFASHVHSNTVPASIPSVCFAKSELHNLRDRVVPHQTIYLSSSTADFPLDVFNAHFLASLVVVVVPLAFRKIDG
jgi:hypothetical protein